MQKGRLIGWMFELQRGMVMDWRLLPGQTRLRTLFRPRQYIEAGRNILCIYAREVLRGFIDV